MGRTPQETITFRLTQILRRLNEGQRLDPHVLSEEFGVNLRTIQRDLNERFAFLEFATHPPPTHAPHATGQKPSPPKAMPSCPMISLNTAHNVDTIH